ncbi:hypothetical protein LJC33_02060 [Eubacteriales bacterium OttesenSCG-928-N13]|nr:hypothetical protein [Eubacteriales bacterium OttesenSCG-928-N13]
MHTEKLKNSGFARLFVWTAKAKYTMGLFFVVFVLFYLFFGLITEGETVALDFFTALQMVFACFFIGILQQALLPASKLNRARCVLWVLFGVVITLGFSVVFGWFAQFPRWCLVVFVLFVAVAMMFMIILYYLELQRETKRLNQGLEQYQKRNTKAEG